LALYPATSVHIERKSATAAQLTDEKMFAGVNKIGHKPSEGKNLS